MLMCLGLFLFVFYSSSVPLPVLQCFISDSQLTRDAALHLGLENSFTFTLLFAGKMYPHTWQCWENKHSKFRQNTFYTIFLLSDSSSSPFCRLLFLSADFIFWMNIKICNKPLNFVSQKAKNHKIGNQELLIVKHNQCIYL